MPETYGKLLHELCLYSYLQDADDMLVFVGRKIDFDSWVDDGLHLCEDVRDVTERRLAVHEVVQDTTERPHVTFYTDLK